MYFPLLAGSFFVRGRSAMPNAQSLVRETIHAAEKGAPE